MSPRLRQQLMVSVIAAMVFGCGGGDQSSPTPPVATSAGDETVPDEETSNVAEVTDLFNAIGLGPVQAGQARLSAASYEDADAERARGACLSVLEAMLAGAAETFDLDRHCIARLEQLAEATGQSLPDVSSYRAMRAQARATRLASAPPLPEGFSPDTGERTFTGTLTDDDPRVPDDDSPYDEYPIDLRAGTTVRIDMMSDDFDCYLWLIGPDGTALVQDDDGGEGLNSRINHVVQVDGTHTVRANSYDGTGRGSYELRAAIEP